VVRIDPDVALSTKLEGREAMVATKMELE